MAKRVRIWFSNFATGQEPLLRSSLYLRFASGGWKKTYSTNGGEFHGDISHGIESIKKNTNVN